MVANNVLGPRARLDDFVGGLATRAEAGRRAHDRGAAPAAPDRASRVRHDLPRAPLLLLAARGPDRARAGAGCGSSTSRSCRPTAAVCGSGRRSTKRREAWPQTPAVERVLESERAAGLDALETYAAFARRVARVLDELRSFLREAQAEGARVAAYGAAAKGNTLLNAAGVGPDDIAYVVDRSPHKQGLFMPGSPPAGARPRGRVADDRPDYLLMLPWNFATRSSSRWPTCATGAAGSSCRCRGSRYCRDLAGTGPARRVFELSRSRCKTCAGCSPHVRPQRIRRAGLDHRSRRQASPSTPGAAPCVASTCSGRRTRRQSSFAAWPAPCSTSSSTCGRIANTAFVDRQWSYRRSGAMNLPAAGARARLPDARRRRASSST